MHTGEGVAVPAQSKDIPRTQPSVFEWYENRAEEGFSKLYRVDVGQRQMIIEIIRELNDSNMFHKLLSAYGDENQLADGNYERETDALMAFVSRVYIAGTLRGCQAVDL